MLKFIRHFCFDMIILIIILGILEQNHILNVEWMSVFDQLDAIFIK